MLGTSQKIVPIFVVGLLCLLNALPLRADNFLLEFTPTQTTGFPGPCNMGFGNPVMCEIGGVAEETDPDTTPYTQETVVIDSVEYWHQIIGDPDEGFAMEVYIRKGAVALTSVSGGRNSNFPGVGSLYRTDLDVQSGNGWDPLGFGPSVDFDVTGNGTADPTRVVMRQILGGSWNATTNTWSCGTVEFCMDFTKDDLNTKPRIMQTVNDVPFGFTANFELDMSNSSYDDDTTAGTIINAVTFDTDIGIPISPTVPTTGNGNGGNINNGGNFDMATDTQKSTVTGGRYTYTAGAGWIETGINTGYQTWDYDEGNYNYIGGAFDQLSPDWSNYFDPAQNALPGSGNQAKCDSGAVTGSCP